MVILTEKPSVAKSIGEALNFTKDKNNNWYISSDKQSCIVSAHGHLLELYSPEDYAPESNTKGWSLKQLPIIPTKMLYKKIAGWLWSSMSGHKKIIWKYIKCYEIP